MKRIFINILLALIQITVTLAAKKNLIIDTDLFSDVEYLLTPVFSGHIDAGALLLAATSEHVNLLAVNINTRSSYSALAASAILSHYGKKNIPIGILRPLTNATFFDSWSYEVGEYASKVAYHFSGGSLTWGCADDAWDPVALYRKVLAEAEDGSVTIASIGFLDNLSALLNSTSDACSGLNGRDLVSQKVSELVVMGGKYPSGRSWNFWGSNPSLAAHVINTWSWEGRVTFIGGDVGKHVLTGGPLMAEGPKRDPVRMAYIYYSYYEPRPSWDPLTILYAIHGLGDTFEIGNEYGYNHIHPDGTNEWVWTKQARKQHFLRLKADNQTVATEIDRLFLQGALMAEAGHDGPPDWGSLCGLRDHEEL